MKKLNIKKLGVILLTALVFASCEKWIDPDINVDPNKPEDVPMLLILPSIQTSWAYTIGGDLAMPARLWTQQLAGSDRQALAYDRYTITEGDMNNLWRFNTYSASLMDNKILIDKAIEVNSPAYLGVGQVLWALQFLGMTDMFGDIPYSEALQGKDFVYPTFDTQESILTDLEKVLNDAITNLNTAIPLQGDPLYVFPGADDLIYGGDLNLWIKAANAVKARLYLHWGEKDASKLSLIQAAIDASFADQTEDMQLAFGATEGEANPLYQFETQREGYVLIGAHLVNQLNGGTPFDKTDDDPRLALFATGTGGADGDTLLADTTGNSVLDSIPPGSYFGAPVGTPASLYSDVGPEFGAINSTVRWFTYAELKYIEAELNVGTAVGDTAFVHAVKASYSMYGLPEPTVVASNVTLADIIGQKYLGLAMQIEVYNDYRRTGLPALTTYQGLPVPKRYPYGSAAFDYNPDNAIKTTKNTPVWWNE